MVTDKKMLTMNTAEKHTTQRNTTSDNASCPCQHEKYPPLQIERGNGFQEQCIDILKII